MKRFILCVVFALLAISVLSVSADIDIDLSTLSYSELSELVTQAQREMMTRREFQSVEVPGGVYQVGVEIPAGKWTIAKHEKALLVHVEIGTTLTKDGNGIVENSSFNVISLSGANPTATITLPENYYVSLTSTVTFSNAAGLGFNFN